MTLFKLTDRHVLIIDGELYRFTHEKTVGINITMFFKNKFTGEEKTFIHDHQVVRCAGGWKIKQD